MGEVPSPISAVRGDPKTALAPQFWGTLRIGSPQSWGVRGAKSSLYSATPSVLAYRELRFFTFYFFSGVPSRQVSVNKTPSKTAFST